MSNVAYNPYAAPQADLRAPRTGDLAEAERIPELDDRARTAIAEARASLDRAPD